MKNFEDIFKQASSKTVQIPVDTIRRIYFMGIKGVGMTAVAIIAKEAGFEVRGCDVEQTFITDSSLAGAGIDIDTGFDSHALKKFMEGINSYEGLVIITGAHNGLKNPVAEWAIDHDFPVITQGQAVGLFMDGHILNRQHQHGISISGAHGKTTISAMFATVLQALGEDPTYVVGTGQVYPLGYPGHFGTGHIFVAEADEYASDIMSDPTPKLFYQKPKYLVLNNIDFDHPDFYHDIEEIEQVFSVFLKHLPTDSIVIANGDDERVRRIVSSLKTNKLVFYGSGDHNDLQLRNFVQSETESTYIVYKNDTVWGEFVLKVPGIHNALNSLSVIAVCDALGFKADQIQEGLAQFIGSKRRSEIVGMTQLGAIIIDDYAHHPKEIEITLQSLKNAYHDKNIVCIFQPHTHTRTKSLASEFASSLTHADQVVLLPVFASARESSSSEDASLLVFDLLKQSHDSAQFFETKDDVIKYITQNYDNPDTVIVTMGAGDVYSIGNELLKETL